MQELHFVLLWHEAHVDLVALVKYKVYEVKVNTNNNGCAQNLHNLPISAEVIGSVSPKMKLNILWQGNQGRGPLEVVNK